MDNSLASLQYECKPDTRYYFKPKDASRGRGDTAQPDEREFELSERVSGKLVQVFEGTCVEFSADLTRIGSDPKPLYPFKPIKDDVKSRAFYFDSRRLIDTTLKGDLVGGSIIQLLAGAKNKAIAHSRSTAGSNRE